MRLFKYLAQGKEVPELCFTNPISELLMDPLTVTSLRKLPELADCPDLLFA